MKIKKLKLLFLFLILTIVSSCASRPKLYPNQTLKSRGKEAGEADINQCLKDADTYMDSSEGKKILKSTGFGAAVGGAGGAVSGSLSPDELKHRYVNQCLADKGYHVLGWD